MLICALLFSIYYFSLIKLIPEMINTVSAKGKDLPVSVLTTSGEVDLPHQILVNMLKKRTFWLLRSK